MRNHLVLAFLKYFNFQCIKCTPIRPDAFAIIPHWYQCSLMCEMHRSSFQLINQHHLRNQRVPLFCTGPMVAPHLHLAGRLPHFWYLALQTVDGAAHTLAWSALCKLSPTNHGGTLPTESQCSELGPA